MNGKRVRSTAGRELSIDIESVDTASHAIEYYTPTSMGERLHRCLTCVRLYWLVNGVPATDCGFVSVARDPHIYANAVQ
jgi:hypothetical protein